MKNPEKAAYDYYSDLTNRIKAYNKEIHVVENLKSIGHFNYDRKTYPELTALLKSGRLDEAHEKY